VVIKVSWQNDYILAYRTLCWWLFANSGLANVANKIGLAFLKMAEAQSFSLIGLFFAQSNL
jgi:hypothetical protein